MNKLLKVKNLSINFKVDNEEKNFQAVKNISFDLNKGEVLGIVGESGSGKSVTALSILSLVPENKVFYSKNTSIKLNDTELINAKNSLLNEIRGGKIGFVFQEPMSSLNPLHKIGNQIAETIILHQKMSYKQAKEKTLELLKIVGIKNYIKIFTSDETFLSSLMFTVKFAFTSVLTINLFAFMLIF